jgi:hypothetical protein
MDDDLDPSPLPEGVVPFRPRAARAPSETAPTRPMLVRQRERFVYDVAPLRGGFGVMFETSVITRHPDLDSAIANARLIAGNMWSNGIPSAVRVIASDGGIRPVVSYG